MKNVRVRQYTRRSPTKSVYDVAVQKTRDEANVAAMKAPAQKAYKHKTPVSGWPREKMTRSNGGKPLRVVMDERYIYAYHAEPAQVVSTKFEGDETRIEIEPTLSKYFTEEPVMKIWKI